MEYNPNEEVLKQIAETLDTNMEEKEKIKLKNAIKINHYITKECPDYDIHINRRGDRTNCEAVGKIEKPEEAGGAFVNATIGLVIAAQKFFNVSTEDILDAVYFSVQQNIGSAEIKEP